jgi:hypothetical protein
MSLGHRRAAHYSGYCLDDLASANTDLTAHLLKDLAALIRDRYHLVAIGFAIQRSADGSIERYPENIL